MRHATILLFALFSCLNTQAQIELPKLPAVEDFRLLKRIELEAKHLTTDPLGNFYVVTNTNRIIKYSPQGDSLFAYNEGNNGDIGAIDAGNPVQIIVYYPLMQTLTFLDRTLTRVKEVTLSDLQLNAVNVVCRSQDDGVWLMDPSQNRVVKILSNGTVRREGQDLAVQTGESIEPSAMQESGAHLYLYAPYNGVTILDLFGNYVKTLMVKGQRNFQAFGSQLILHYDTFISIINMETGESAMKEIPPAAYEMQMMSLSSNRLVVLKEGYLLLYEF